MHGNDFYQVFIAFQPQLIFRVFFVFSNVLQLCFQPLRQCGGRNAFVGGQCQDFSQLPEVGETAFVAGVQKVLLEAALAGKAGERGVDAVLPPGFGGGFGQGDPLGQAVFVAVQFGQVLRGVAIENAAEHEAQVFGLLRCQPKQQQGVQGFSFGRVEH